MATTEVANNNDSVKHLITQLTKIIDVSPISRYEYILKELCKDWIKGYIKQFDACIKKILVLIQLRGDTPNLMLQYNVNVSNRASLVYLLNQNKEKANASISKFFHTSLKSCEIMNDGNVAALAFNTVDGDGRFNLNNDQSQRIIYEKYHNDYTLLTLFYKIAFKEDYILSDYKPKIKQLFKMLMRELKWENILFRPTITKEQQSWWIKEFCDDQKKNFMGEDYNICDNCEELYCISKSQDDLQLEDGVGFCSPECYEEHYDKEEELYNKDMEYKCWVKDCEKEEFEDYCAWLEVKQIDCGDDKLREEYNQDWGVNKSRERFDMFNEIHTNTIPNDDEWCYKNHNECICETGGCHKPTYDNEDYDSEDDEEEIDGETILL